MPYTSDSSPSPYFSAQDFFNRFNITLACQLCSDDPSQPIDTTSIYTNSKLIAAISDACGQMEAALFVGERYGSADLSALTGVSQQYMFRILSDIAAYNLWSLRGASSPPESVVKGYERAQELLHRLSDGENIFSFAEVGQAGIPETKSIKASDYWTNNFISSRWQRMFGPRAKDLQ